MSTKRPKPEEIVVKLRRVEILMGQGMPRLDAIRQIGVTEQTHYCWKTVLEPHLVFGSGMVMCLEARKMALTRGTFAVCC